MKPQHSLDLFGPAEKRGATLAHNCRCGAWGSFGRGWPRVAVQEWFCRQHLPADYWSAK